MKCDFRGKRKSEVNKKHIKILENIIAILQ